MRACSMFSGGKDSTYALHWAALHGFDVCCLLSLR
ncbi:MAG TPA: ATP-binding protein, partial [Pyrodictium delaneyi]|nr:ATP-binding protein [Pyrodictium delaneyi]